MAHQRTRADHVAIEILRIIPSSPNQPRICRHMYSSHVGWSPAYPFPPFSYSSNLLLSLHGSNTLCEYSQLIPQHIHFLFIYLFISQNVSFIKLLRYSSVY